MTARRLSKRFLPPKNLVPNMPVSLQTLLRDIRACRLCLEAPKGPPLPHEPRPVVRVSTSARLAVCGQAPGARVHASGVPFSDPSGVRLRQWMGVTDEDFYDASRVAIVPMGFCFPGLDAKGGDLPPRKECAQRWRARLFAQLPNVELILLVGQYAQAWHLGADRKPTLTETVRDWRRIVTRPDHPRMLPLPHPSWRNTAWLKANPWFETELLPVLKHDVKALLN
jgi:uracil-DNA glycosylase